MSKINQNAVFRGSTPSYLKRSILVFRQRRLKFETRYVTGIPGDANNKLLKQVRRSLYSAFMN